MNHLVHGEVRGLTWYEVPRAAAGWGARYVDEGFDVITVVAPLGKFPCDHVMGMLRTNPAATSIATTNFPFRPFDEAVELPGRAVMYAHHDFTDADIDAWAKANLPIPDGIDLTFSMSQSRGAVYASAATVRKGRLVHVKRRLDGGKPFGDALAEHIPYFVRNCPKPTGDLAEFTCGAHAAAILASLPTPSAVAVVEEWLERHRQAPPAGVASITLGTEFMPGTGVNRMVLDMFPGTNAVSATIDIAGGHSIVEDDTGLEIRLNAVLPDTVADALKGRSLADVLELGWAGDVRIRLVRERKTGVSGTSLRGEVESVSLALPRMPTQTVEQAETEIRAMTTGERPRWTLVEATALPILRQLTRPDLATVMTRLIVEHQIDLAPYGQPGWVLRGRGLEIVVEECPSHEADRLLDLL
jgi:hypothetical protein